MTRDVIKYRGHKWRWERTLGTGWYERRDGDLLHVLTNADGDSEPSIGEAALIGTYRPDPNGEWGDTIAGELIEPEWRPDCDGCDEQATDEAPTREYVARFDGGEPQRLHYCDECAAGAAGLLEGSPWSGQAADEITPTPATFAELLLTTRGGRAESEGSGKGWDLFERDSPNSHGEHWEIQRVDEEGVFPSDEAAVAHVFQLAANGDGDALASLAAYRNLSPLTYKADLRGLSTPRCNDCGRPLVEHLPRQASGAWGPCPPPAERF